MDAQTLRLTCKRGCFKLELLAAPEGLSPTEDSREVHVVIGDSGCWRAVLFLLPDKNSDDPDVAMNADEWSAPARWDDPTMLFVPSFDNESILAAFEYVLDNMLEASAFEHEDYWE